MIRRFLCRWLSLHDADEISCHRNYKIVRCPHCGITAEVWHNSREVKIIGGDAMKTLLIALTINSFGQYERHVYEMAPIACASLMQDVAENADPRIQMADGTYSPPLAMAACIEVKE